jgi:hypothetical protein
MRGCGGSCSHGSEDSIGGVAGAAFEMAAAEMALGFHVSDHGFDGGAASQLAFDSAEDAALLARDEDTAWMRGIVAPISLVDVGALDLTAAELLGTMTARSVWPSYDFRAALWRAARTGRRECGRWSG